VQDTTAPYPNPSRWETEPNLVSATSITMTAETAYDDWGWDVEYYFECVYGDCHDSGWQKSPTYTDRGLKPDLGYGYLVRTRDEVGNVSEPSEIRFAGTDVTPPAPAPRIVTIEPNSWNAISMEATIAYDVSEVEYYFQSVTDGGHDSGWLDEPNYTDVGLDPSTEYGYQVKARDRSSNQNETGWSDIVYATTLDAPDVIAPTPDPMQWDTIADANGLDGTPREVFGLVADVEDPFNYSAVMRATIAIDDSGGIVEYFFQCTTNSGFSSGWQIDPSYTVLVGRRAQAHRFRVKARDEYGNETRWSIELAAD
jgi:hypothetical protein